MKPSIRIAAAAGAGAIALTVGWSSPAAACESTEYVAVNCETLIVDEIVDGGQRFVGGFTPGEWVGVPSFGGIAGPPPPPPPIREWIGGGHPGDAVGVPSFGGIAGPPPPPPPIRELFGRDFEAVRRG